MTHLMRTSRADLSPYAVAPTQPRRGRGPETPTRPVSQRPESTTWKAVGQMFLLGLTWLWGLGSEFSKVSSCWSFASAEPTSRWSSKNSVYWSWNTAA